jgi:hypothetical protein
MKKVMYLIVLTTLFMGCKNNSETQAEETEVVASEPMAKYQSFGESITDKEVLSQEEMLLKYGELKLGDTVALKFTSKVNSVCQAKGCWMRLDLGEQESFVKFKDYGFFMPKDIAGQEVIVEGKAFVEETSVEDLKHFALDAGKPQEEIDAITEPELTYAFISSGVLIPEKQ